MPDRMTYETDWSGLPFFLAVARSGSLRAAAEALGGTHATVNRKLLALETAYGVRLFERTRSGLSLTAAGEELLPQAEAAEASIISARRRLQGRDQEASGQVHLTVPPWFAYEFLAEPLSRFMTRYPEIDLRVTCTNRMQDLTKSEADVSVRVAFEVDDDVVGRRILQYAVSTYASRDYLDRHFNKSGPDGEGLHWIGWGERKTVPDWVRASAFPKAEKKHWVRDGLMQVHLVRNGLGMSNLPVYVEHLFPELVRVPGAKIELNRSIWLLLHSDLRRTKRVRLLVDFLADELKALTPIFLGPLDGDAK